MPADPETLAAIQAVADRVDKKLDAHQAASAESTRRVHEKVEEHARESRATIEKTSLATSTALSSLASQVAAISSELHSHTQYDTEQFRRHEESIKDLQKEDGKIWRTFAKAAAGGGVVGAALAKAVEAMGGKGPG